MQSFNESLNFFQKQELNFGGKMGEKGKTEMKAQRPTKNGSFKRKESVSCISKQLFDEPVSVLCPRPTPMLISHF